MQVPDRIKVKHASMREKDRLPYPCGYCFNTAMVKSISKKPEKKVLTIFPGTCDAGIEHMDDFGKCKRFYENSEYREHCILDIFKFLESDYMMYCLSEIYEHEQEGITRSNVVNRKERGYVTRATRLDELESLGLIETVPDIHGKKFVYCTPMGENIVREVRNLYDVVVLTFEEGDTFNQDGVVKLFEFIAQNPDCDKRAIYGHVMDMDDPTTPLRALLDSRYIEARFVNDYETYNVSPRGSRAYDRYNQPKDC